MTHMNGWIRPKQQLNDKDTADLLSHAGNDELKYNGGRKFSGNALAADWTLVGPHLFMVNKKTKATAK
jgi:hypothetical protein